MHPSKNIQKIEQLRCDSDNRTIGHNPQNKYPKTLRNRTFDHPNVWANDYFTIFLKAFAENSLTQAPPGFFVPNPSGKKSVTDRTSLPSNFFLPQKISALQIHQGRILIHLNLTKGRRLRKVRSVSTFLEVANYGTVDGNQKSRKNPPVGWC